MVANMPHMALQTKAVVPMALGSVFAYGVSNTNHTNEGFQRAY
jgi:hypothetical protein